MPLAAGFCYACYYVFSKLLSRRHPPETIMLVLFGLVGLFLYGEPVWADVTFSATCWIWHRDGKRSWPYKLVNALFFWQDDHCKAAYDSEVERSQVPPELR